MQRRVKGGESPESLGSGDQLPALGIFVFPFIQDDVGSFAMQCQGESGRLMDDRISANARILSQKPMLLLAIPGKGTKNPASRSGPLAVRLKNARLRTIPPNRKDILGIPRLDPPLLKRAAIQLQRLHRIRLLGDRFGNHVQRQTVE